MLKRLINAATLSLFTFIAFLPSLQLQAAENATDVRLLIDISGSMKANDPNNLRVPALDLMVDLLPKGSKAGVWAFASQVNMLVPHAEVNKAWREKARKQVDKINSVGLFTNIGAVLDKATFDKNSPTSKERHLILLTDGMVDVSKDKKEDLRAREDILQRQLKLLAEKNYKIHTIALSDNSDKELLETLSIESGGLNASAKTADDLSQLFLSALSQSAPVDEVPLVGNSFLIDSSIDEFTLLAFKSTKTSPMSLLAPDEARYKQGHQGDGVAWHEGDSYALITVENPFEGEWVLEGDLDPKNRVAIVSNLKMDVGAIPSNIFAGQALNVDVSFSDSGQAISRADFLGLIDLKMVLDSEERSIELRPTKFNSEGVFRFDLSELRDADNYRLSIKADGKTFKREFKRKLSVRQPFSFKAELQEAENDSYRISVTSNARSIDRNATKIIAKVRKPGGSSNIRGLVLHPQKSIWTFDIENLTEGTYRVSFDVEAQTTDGDVFKIKPDVLKLNYPDSLEAKVDGGLVAPVAAKPEAELKKEPEPVEAQQEPIVEEAAVEPEAVEPPAENAEPSAEEEPSAQEEPLAQEEPSAQEEEPVASADEAPAADADEETSVQEEPPVEDATADEAIDEEEAPSKLWLYIGVVLANLLLLGLIGFAYYKFIHKPNQGDVEEDGDVDAEK